MILAEYKIVCGSCYKTKKLDCHTELGSHRESKLSGWEAGPYHLSHICLECRTKAKKAQD